LLQNFYAKYRIRCNLFNKNLLIADTGSLFVSALFAEVYFKLISMSYIANSILIALVESPGEKAEGPEAFILLITTDSKIDCPPITETSPFMHEAELIRLMITPLPG
jgi:hypothetical protein